MRLLVASIASHGHTYPLLPFAVAARDAGHEVLYATGPELLDVVTRLGFRPVPTGGDIGAAFGQARTADGRDFSARESLSGEEVAGLVGQVFGDIIPRRVVADLSPALDELRPDLVVHEAGNTGAALAARAAGIPGLRHGFGRSGGGTMVTVASGHLTTLADELGVSPSALSGPGLGDPYLDICPRSLQNEDFLAAFDETGGSRWPLRPVPFAEPGDIPEWATEPGPPLVYLTLGTAFAQNPVLRTIIAGLSRLPVRVLVAAGPRVDAGTLDGLPETVRVVQWVPQADVLGHTTLIVHHGGSGTMLGALVHGLPQLLLPQGADQFTNAEAIVTAGAGTRLLPHELSEDAVAESASALLADAAVRETAAGLAAEIAAMPSPADVVARLPELVRS